MRAAMRDFKSQYPRADTAFVNCVELARGSSSRGQLASLLTALHANSKRANGATAGNDELLRKYSTRNKEMYEDTVMFF